MKKALIIAVMTALVGLGASGEARAHGPRGRGNYGGSSWKHRGMPAFGGAGWGGMHHGMRGFHRFGRRGRLGAKPWISLSLRFRDELKLTDEQIEKLKDLRLAYYQKRIRDRAEVQIARLNIRRAVRADKVDLADVEKRIRAMEKMRADMRIERIRTIEKGKAVLSDAQRKKLRELVRARFRRFHRFGRGPGGPGMMGPGYGMMGPGAGPGTMGPGQGPGTMGPGAGPPGSSPKGK